MSREFGPSAGGGDELRPEDTSLDEFWEWLNEQPPPPPKRKCMSL